MNTEGQKHYIIRAFLKQRLGVIGFLVIIVEITLFLLAPFIISYRPTKQHLDSKLQVPSWEHLMGTDQFGRDIFSRILYGGRNTLGGGIVALFILTLLGVIIGGLAGYAGGAIEWFLMRLTDAVLAFPYLVLALSLAAALSPSLLSVVMAVSLTWWGHFSRVIHGMVLSLRDIEYVEAARALGSSHVRIVLHHILPNVIPPVIVLASLDFGLVILAIAALSYLGLGIQPPAAEWGMMLNGARLYMFLAPHIMIFPGLMIFISVLASNLAGDALREVLDPRRRIKR